MAAATCDSFVRTQVVASLIGPFAAFVLSGACMIAATSAAAWFLASRAAAPEEHYAWAVGLLWVAGTLVFEALIVRVMRGETLISLFEHYDLRRILEGEFIVPGLIFMSVGPWPFDRAAAGNDGDEED